MVLLSRNYLAFPFNTPFQIFLREMSSFLSNLELMWDFGTFPFPIMYTDVTGKQYKRERMIQLHFAIIPESTVI